MEFDSYYAAHGKNANRVASGRISARSAYANGVNSERERRYPILSALDLTLNFLLCCGVFTGACMVLGLILLNNAPVFLTRFSFFASHIFN